ncbi:MAG: cation transporting ATPase C-terminal domain-containing protein [Eubacteriales bacterium]
MDWATISAAEAARRLHSDLKKGMSRKAALRARDKYGSNYSLEAGTGVSLLSALEKAADPALLIYAVASLIFLAFGRESAAGAMTFLAVISYIGGTAVAYISRLMVRQTEKLTRIKTKTIREGRLKTLSSLSLVPGDLILLETGDLVPAEARVVLSNDLRVMHLSRGGGTEEYTKRCEVSKERPDECMVHAGDVVSAGNGQAMVVSTGKRSDIPPSRADIPPAGRSRAAGISRLEKQSASFSKSVSLLWTAGVAGLLMISVLAGLDIPSTLAVALALGAAFPPDRVEMLCSLAVSGGIHTLASQSLVLIKGGEALDTLNNLSVYLAPKNQSFTHAGVRVEKVYSDYWEYEVDPTHAQRIGRILTLASLCTDVAVDYTGREERFLGAPTDVAINKALSGAGFYRTAVDSKYMRLEKIRGSEGFSTVLCAADGGFLLVTLGDALSVLERCSAKEYADKTLPLSPKALRACKDSAYEMSKRYGGVLAVAVKRFAQPTLSRYPDKEGGFALCGYICLSQTSRSGAAMAVSRCRAAGLRTVMLADMKTQGTSFFAQSMGILERGGTIVTGEDVSRMGEGIFYMDAAKHGVYAGLSTAQRVTLIKALRRREAVGHSASGIMDLPAVREADLTITGAANDLTVIQSAADVILQDTSMRGIYTALRGASAIYHNMRRIAAYLSACGTSLFVCTVISLIYMQRSVFSPAQLVWAGLTCAVCIVPLCFYVKGSTAVLDRKRSLRSPLLGQGAPTDIVVLSVLCAAGGLLSYYLGERYLGGAERLLGGSGGMAYLTLLSTFTLLSLSVRGREGLLSALWRYPAHLWTVLGALGVSLALCLIPPLSGLLGFTSVSLAQAGTAVGVSVVACGVYEVVKKIKKSVKD